MRPEIERVPEAGFLLIGDVHLSSLPPSRRVDDYPSTVLARLAECARVARERNLVPLILGDLFHRPREPDEGLKTRLVRVLRSFHRTPLCNVGNHDVRGDTLQDGDSLMYLAESGLLRVPSVAGPFAEFELSTGVRAGLGMVPWGQPIPDDVTGWFPEADGTFLLTHHDLAFDGAYPGAAPLKEIPGCSIVVNGHMHLTKPMMEAGETTWCNFGSITSTAIDAVGHRPVAVDFRPDRDGLFEFIDLGGEDGVWDLVSTLAPKRPARSSDGAERDFARALAEDLAAEARRTSDGGILAEELRAFLSAHASEACAARVASLLVRAAGRESETP